MENLLFQIGVIKGFGTMAGPVKGDLRIPMIATRDIGDAAADALLQLNFQGKSAHELQGARDITNTEAAKTIGAAIGKADLTYKQMPAAQLKPGFMQMGMSSNMADLLLGQLADSAEFGTLKKRWSHVPQRTPLPQRWKLLQLKFSRRPIGAKKRPTPEALAAAARPAGLQVPAGDVPGIVLTHAFLLSAHTCAFRSIRAFRRGVKSRPVTWESGNRREAPRRGRCGPSVEMTT